jgi:ribosomal-protein-alanine N-acetyltransferase
MTNKPVIICETERLILRRQTLADLDQLYAIYQDPDVVRYIPDRSEGYEAVRAEVEWHMNGWPNRPELGLWATIYKPTNTFIGRCGLLPWTIEGKEEVEVAYLLAKAYWGRGLATEAARAVARYGFETLRLPRLISLIDPDNKASARVATKIGMVFEREFTDEYGPAMIFAMNNPQGM